MNQSQPGYGIIFKLNVGLGSILDCWKYVLEIILADGDPSVNLRISNKKKKLEAATKANAV